MVCDGLQLAEKSAAKRISIVSGAFTVDNKEFFIEMNAKKFGEQFFITIRDITAMTNILAAAERTGRLNKDKNIMIAKLANELRSRVHSIIGLSQALLEGVDGDIAEKESKYVRIFKRREV